MSFKRKMRRAAEKEKFTEAEIKKVCRLIMDMTGIQRVDAVDLGGGNIDFTFVPDRDYRNNQLVMSLCSGISFYMLEAGITSFTYPTYATENKKSVLNGFESSNNTL